MTIEQRNCLRNGHRPEADARCLFLRFYFNQRFEMKRTPRAVANELRVDLVPFEFLRNDSGNIVCTQRTGRGLIRKWAPDHKRADAMRIWCEERDLSLLQMALQFCLSDDRVHGNPIGSLNAEQLELNVRAAATPLPQETIEEFLRAGL